MGFKPRDIVALQGPFSHELNVALFTAYAAEVVVTKNSGAIGGSDTKFTAAVALSLPLVIIDRPAVQYSAVVASIPAVINFVKEVVL
jgi:precorrin-6A/cobalt-precorrin-6A reductase